MHPYRENATKTRKPLPRRLAWLRGTYRRIVFPVQVFCILGAFFTVFNSMRCVDIKTRQDNADAENKRHFDDWQKSIDENQRKLDERAAKLDAKQQELTDRSIMLESVRLQVIAQSQGLPTPSLPKRPSTNNP